MSLDTVARAGNDALQSASASRRRRRAVAEPVALAPPEAGSPGPTAGRRRPWSWCWSVGWVGSRLVTDEQSAPPLDSAPSEVVGARLSVPVELTVPEGWVVTRDAQAVELRPLDGSDRSITLVGQPVMVYQPPDYQLKPLRDDLVVWTTTHPDLEVSDQFGLDGPDFAWTGTEMELALSARDVRRPSRPRTRPSLPPDPSRHHQGRPDLPVGRHLPHRLPAAAGGEPVIHPRRRRPQGSTQRAAAVAAGQSPTQLVRSTHEFPRTTTPTTGYASGLRATLALLVAMISTVALSSPADAAMLERGTFDDEDSFTFDDCGFTVAVDERFVGWYTIGQGTKQTNGEFFRVHQKTTYSGTFTNVETGDYFTSAWHTNFREMPATIVDEDGPDRDVPDQGERRVGHDPRLHRHRSLPQHRQPRVPVRVRHRRRRRTRWWGVPLRGVRQDVGTLGHLRRRLLRDRGRADRLTPSEAHGALTAGRVGATSRNVSRSVRRRRDAARSAGQLGVRWVGDLLQRQPVRRHHRDGRRPLRQTQAPRPPTKPDAGPPRPRRRHPPVSAPCCGRRRRRSPLPSADPSASRAHSNTRRVRTVLAPSRRLAERHEVVLAHAARRRGSVHRVDVERTAVPDDVGAPNRVDTDGVVADAVGVAPRRRAEPCVEVRRRDAQPP